VTDNAGKIEVGMPVVFSSLPNCSIPREAKTENTSKGML
jgi:hypothetical protein